MRDAKVRLERPTLATEIKMPEGSLSTYWMEIKKRKEREEKKRKGEGRRGKGRKRKKKKGKAIKERKICAYFFPR